MKAVIFPGQGSQYVGMGKSLYESFSPARDIFFQIDNILGFELSQKCFSGTESELKDTAIQQLAILAVSLAAYEVLKSKDIKADYVSGLSLGEYTCLYAAQVLSLEDLVRLVKARAAAMQQAAEANPSTMLAVIGADREFLAVKARDCGFYISNLNCPGQAVISLRTEDCWKVKDALVRAGLKVVELTVSGGFHSPFMEPAKQALTQVMEEMDFCDARIPLVSNFTARAHTGGEEIKNNLREQLVSPVLWNSGVDFMVAAGVGLFFEAGPGRVLRGLIRKINSQVEVVNIEKKEDLEFVCRI